MDMPRRFNQRINEQAIETDALFARKVVLRAVSAATVEQCVKGVAMKWENGDSSAAS